MWSRTPKGSAKKTKSAPKLSQRNHLSASRASSSVITPGTDSDFSSVPLDRSASGTPSSSARGENHSGIQLRKFRLVTVYFLFVVIILLGIFLIRDQRGPTLQFGSKTLQLEIANTDELRTKGLSGRDSLPSNEAMWFEFRESSVHCFWMKDMNFPIDIIWLNEQRKVVHIKEDAQPSSFPESFCPSESSQYVLEVQAGLAKQQNIAIGSQL